MTWRSPKLLILTGGLVAVAIVGGITFAVSQRQPPPKAAVPTGILGLPSVTETPVVVTAVPTSVNAALFANPSEPAYIPGKGLSPDAQRIIDIAMLQTFLERYRVAQRRYPPSLADLFPLYADDETGKPLAAQPTDPVTHSPYSYRPSPDGATYRVSATLSSGKEYTGIPCPHLSGPHDA